jgi:hypothetical protein
MAEHLLHVAWDASSAKPLDCVVGITRCIASGHFLVEAGDDPGLLVRNVARFTDFVAQQFGPKLAFASADEEQAFENAVMELAGALGIRAAGAGGLTRMFLLMVARQLGEALLQWLESLDDTTPAAA